MLVSVVIPTYRRAALLAVRALPSVLRQTHFDLDVHVVGDGTDDETADVVAACADGRVRFTNIERTQYPTDPEAAWCAIGYRALNHGIGAARGEWIAALADDDEWPLDRLEYMLALADEDVDVVYGKTDVVGHGLYGSWPPGPAAFTDGAAIWRTSLGLRYNEQSWQEGRPADFLLRADIAARFPGRIAYTSRVVYRYWPAHKVPPVEAYA